MMSTSRAMKKIGEDSQSGKLLQEIEVISKALYLDKTTPKLLNPTGVKAALPESKSKTRNVTIQEALDPKDKKSFWNWKSLKSLTHIRNKRFTCSFSLIVHSIEGLPSNFNLASLRVHWKRKDEELVTQSEKVVDGVAEFDQRLSHTCTVYGSRSGPHHSAKYEAKHFLLYASLFGSPELELGKHRVDLTRLLPLTLEELDEEKSSGTWTTNFKLSGRAKGATLHVSFGYSVLKDNPNPPVNKKASPQAISKQSSMSIARYGSTVSRKVGGPSVRRTGSLPNNPERWPRLSSRSVDDIKVMTTSTFELHSLTKSPSSKLSKGNTETSVQTSECDVFTVNCQPVNHSSLLHDSDEGNADKENEISAVVDEDELPCEGQDRNRNRGEDMKIVEASAREKEILEEVCDKNELSMPQHGGELVHEIPCEDGNRGEKVLKIVEASFAEEANKEKRCLKNEICIPDPEHEIKSMYEKPDDFADRLEDKKIVEDTARKESNMVDMDAGTTIQALEEVRDQLVCPAADEIEDDIYSQTTIMEELESALETLSSLELAVLDSPEDEDQADYMFFDDSKRKGKSVGFDDETDMVACEFLNQLGLDDNGLSSDSEPESPREYLLRQFEKDALADGFPLFDYSCFGEDFDEQDDYDEIGGSLEADLDNDDFDELSSMILAEEEEYLAAIESEASKTKAKMSEDLETEALMREWGFNEKAFDRSPSCSPLGLGGPVNLLDNPSELPPLCEGLGPVIQTKDGGYIRSMNPSVFQNSKSCGSLIMQVSSPVVVPAEMGSDVMGILQGLASVGIEKLSMQANKLMPLEDITGKTMQQLAWEASPCHKAPEREFDYHQEPAKPRRVQRQSLKSRTDNFNTRSRGKDMRSEYVSLEDLAPLAMDKIEALSLEGLRIQSGVSNEEAPSNLTAQSIGNILALKGKGVDTSGSLGMEGTAGLHLVDVKESNEDVDGLMSLSLTLDEWMRLDSGEFDVEDNQISEQTSKILAAHHANSLGLICGSSKGESRRGNGSRKNCGLLGNNFTVALLVQLRDPLRNYEPVGTPMLALMQVERVFLPPKARVYKVVSQMGNTEKEDDEPQTGPTVEASKVEEGKNDEEKGISQYKITEVHVAGLKLESSTKKLWGSKAQQQSGSRWLVANGMGKHSNNRYPLPKSKSNAPAPAPAGDSLWSLSSLFWGRGPNKKEPADSTSHKRNPNIVFETKAVKLG